MDGWYTRHPQWFVAELEALRRVYPRFSMDEGMLHNGIVVLYGELVVRPPGGARRHAVQVVFSNDSPYAFPAVFPIQALPTFNDDGAAQQIRKPTIFDHRHQMPNGALCLFQYETRVEDGGEAISVVDVLKRAEAWFMGHATGRWPPDSRESELASHFFRSPTQILLSKTFYSDRLHGRGEFFAVKDVHRFFVGRSQFQPPLIMTMATVETGVWEVIDAREDLQHIFPWLTNAAWEPKAFLDFQERQRQAKDIEFGDVARISGHWWELPTEPQVFRDGKGLLGILSSVAEGGDAWSMVSHTLGVDLTKNNLQYVGLCYPGRSELREWLFFVVNTGTLQAQGGFAVQTEQEKRKRFEAATVACIPAHALTAKSINLRNETVVSSQVCHKQVALFGVGALGSKVSELLAQAGVAHFKLCDGDVLNVGNVARHVGGLGDCGAPKTEVVARRIWEVNPYAQIDVLNQHVSPTSPDAENFFAGVDLVVCTIADEGAESGFNDLAVSLQTPVIYGRALRRGQLGRVFLVRPGLDACKTCLSLVAQETHSEWIAVTECPEDALLHECGRPVIAGSAVDLSYVAALIARLALNTLEDRTIVANHLVWSLEGAAELSPLLKHPYSVAQSVFVPKPNCPSCGPAKILTVELPQSVRETMVAEVVSSPATETGGILLGRLDGSKAIIHRATGPGPNAVRTPTKFERDLEFSQQELEAEVSNGNGNIYLGEWHSHLVAVPEPSGRDVLSMTGIAEAANYATDCPVMLICGLDPQTQNVGDIKAWVFPVGSSMRRITILGDHNALTT
ncbi:hypothetical protein GC163_24605 [bacterium]|nr:hypothetical protein [bacterium]